MTIFFARGFMSKEPENVAASDGAVETVDLPRNEIAERVADIEAATTLAEKSNILHALSSEMRHQALGALPATTVAALIEGDPERNTSLLANIPAEKFHQVVGLGSYAQGRQWLERAVMSGSLAAAILPSLMNARDLSEMLLTEPDFRRNVHKLLNFERAERWRQLLTTAEWHHHIDSLLMSDTDELLGKLKFRNKSLQAVLHSLLDFVPELYLETVMAAVEAAKRMDDNPDQFEDIVSMPFTITDADPEESGAVRTESAEDAESPLSDVMPAGGDPVFALATAGLSAARKAALEEQLKNLLRQEILSTASFAQADMVRSAGRVLAYLRMGLESFGSSVEDATQALQTRNLPEVSAIGTRSVEALRQKALSLAGLRDWLDGRQKQFLEAMKSPEAGIHPETREPVLWLAGKPKQDRAEWSPVPISEIRPRIQDISTWVSLAKAAFGTPERVHAIFNTAKTRTAPETLRRTVVALAIYRRWEPELVRPTEDFAAFERQYIHGRVRNLDAVRKIVLDALDQTPDGSWKPSDAKARARELLLRTVDEIEKNKLEDPLHARVKNKQPGTA
jgi:hypothetical protein